MQRESIVNEAAPQFNILTAPNCSHPLQRHKLPCLGWSEVDDMTIKAPVETAWRKTPTCDLERMMGRAKKV
jgi:isocitrate dehydrogenase